MNIEEAKNYIKYLYRKNFLYNFHDGDSAKAVECLMNNTHCSLKESLSIGLKIKKIYEANLDWGEDLSPQGYANNLSSKTGAKIHDAL